MDLLEKAERELLDVKRSLETMLVSIEEVKNYDVESIEYDLRSIVGSVSVPSDQYAPLPSPSELAAEARATAKNATKPEDWLGRGLPKPKK